MTARNSKTETVETVEAPEVQVANLQEVGEARLAVVVAEIHAAIGSIDEAKLVIIDHIRIIQSENLWVFATKEDGSGYANGKEFVKAMLGDALKDWTEATRKSFVVMLVDAGYTATEAGEVTNLSARKAKDAVKEADQEAAVAQGVEGAEPVDTTPSEPTPAEKAAKVVAQSIAMNKKVMDVIGDITVEDLQKLAIDFRVVLVELESHIEHGVNSHAA